MKWSIIALVVLGVLAGLCAALLVISLRAPSPETGRGGEQALPDPKTVKVLVASSDLTARNLVVASSVGFREVKSDAAPPGAFTDPVQIIGKVLLVPMTEGQPFTLACFAADNDRMRLASALTPGTRAVCLTLEDPSGIERILYPGSMVDVLTTLKMQVDENSEQSLAFTLLQNVMVLAVGSQTIVTEPKPAAPEGSKEAPRDTTAANVTLLVDADQAEKLRLAMVTGKVSLVMRNPMDSADGKASGLRIAALAPLIKSIEDHDRQRREKREKEREKEAAAKLDVERQRMADELEKQRMEIAKLRDDNELAKKRYELELEKLRVEKQTAFSPYWETQILRGGVSESKSFLISEAGR